MLIYICCAGGMTSSMFCERVAKASQKKAKCDHIFSLLKELDAYLEEYDIVFAYGPADILRECNLKEGNLESKITSIWIAPQMRHMAPSFQTYFAKKHIPVEVIDMRTFGRMDGKKAWLAISAHLTSSVHPSEKAL